MKITVSLLYFLISALSVAQIGINTDDPLQLLHIDPLKDTKNTPVPSNYFDDVTISISGNLGLGTLSPATRLDIKTAGTPVSPVKGFCLQDGSQIDGYGLTSDNNGYAQWKMISPEGSRKAVRNTSGINIILSDAKTRYYNTDTYIDLPKGRWLLNITMLTPVSSQTYLMKFSIGDTSSMGGSVPLSSSDLDGNTYITAFSWKACNGVIKNTLIIHNTSNITKRYYLLAGNTESNYYINVPNIGGGWGEDVIVAFQIQD